MTTAKSPFGSVRVWLGLVLIVLGVVFASTPSATAQPASATAKKLDAIRLRMERGQALYVAGDYAGAAQVFEEGFKAYPYSAFLFNAGVCYQKLGSVDAALDKFREYLRVDPNAPDAAKVSDRIRALEAQRTPPAAPDAAATEIPSAADGGAEDAGVSADAGAPAPSPAVTSDDETSMKSLVVIETVPEGAPLKLYARTTDSAAPFELGGTNPGWREIQTIRSPASLTLAVGRYHLVVEKFRDFNVSETDIDVSPGHVLHFKANLSQGAFMAFLRVSGNVPGAYVYLDDPAKKRAPWGRTPHSELVGSGKHQLRIEAPGFEPLVTSIDLRHGEQKELDVKLSRVGFGILRIRSNALEVEVEVDEQARGTWRDGEPALDIQLPAGTHKLVVRSPGRKDFEGLVEVPRGQVLPVHATMVQTYPRGAAWTQAIVGTVLVGAAIWAGNESNERNDALEADRRLGVLEESDSRATEGRWYAIGANVGFAGGAILLGLATYNFIRDPLPDSAMQLEQPKEFDDPRKRRPVASRRSGQASANRASGARVNVAPFAGPSSGGLVLGGSF